MFNNDESKNQLDENLLFQFKFISKSKNVTNDFINKIKKISQHSIRELLHGSREKTGFNTLDVCDTNLPNKLEQDFINYIHKKHKVKLENKVKKYWYFRVGDIQRLYGIMHDGIFYAISYQHDKKKQ